MAALKKVVELDKTHDGSLVDVGSLLDELHSNAPEAVRVLRLYLASNAKSDAAPACKAHYLIGSLLQSTGDKVGARQEYQASLALALRYPKARKGLDSL